MRLDHILRSITTKGLQIKNRIVRAAHGTSYGRGVVSENLIASYEARSPSGVGLNILEATVVDRSPVNHTVDPVDDAIIPGFTALAKTCSAHGMRAFVHLWHGGHRWALSSGEARISASDVATGANPRHRPGQLHLAYLDGGNLGRSRRYARVHLL
jgi:2,4-dienoyl-CoA reductase-like NADH-dependent reductase (Old Yellow Enzyme family)